MAVSHEPVVAEPVTEYNQRGVEGGADLIDGLEHEAHQLVRIDGSGLDARSA